MASKEDILEQLVEEYLLHRGYFVRHNVKFRPSKDHSDYISNQDSNHSDIDVLGFNPRLKGPDRVLAVSCKSWQAGFKPEEIINQIEANKTVSGRPAWKGFRELLSPKWTEAFIKEVEVLTGHSDFTYVTAVTHIKGCQQAWSQYQPFINALGGRPIKVFTLRDMLDEVSDQLSTTLAETELGRTLQLFKAAGIKL